MSRCRTLDLQWHYRLAAPRHGNVTGPEAGEAIGVAAQDFPYLAALAEGRLLQPGYAFADDFEPGLDLVLDAVEALPLTG